MWQLSGCWMSASHLLAEEVGDFSRAYVKRVLPTTVPCKGLAFVLQIASIRLGGVQGEIQK